MPMFRLFGAALGTLLAAVPAIAATPHGELEELVVTATPITGSPHDMAQHVSVLTGDALLLDRAPTLGETLAREPGVQSSYFGPAASRPVIRGLGGDRVQVLTDGLATLDVSGLSEDHAVALDPALADQIEVLRGPATLLYGSGAGGGVVNVVTRRIHEQPPDGGHGLVELRGDTALSERALAARADAPLGTLALHLDGVWRRTGDVRIPGFALSPARRAEPDAAQEPARDVRERVPGSASETRSGGAGLSWIGARSSVGMALSRYESDYGIPLAAGLAVALEQSRADLAGRIGLDPARGLWLKLRAAVSDYAHAELEPDGGIGTLYQADGHEVRVVLDHGLPGGAQGTAGVHWQQVELAAAGEEAFVPGSRTRTRGVFLFEQRNFGSASAELGLRLDRQTIDGGSLPGYDGRAFNISVGGRWPLSGGVALVGQLLRSERHPTATELYADGPHAATRQFEIGDAGFGTERGVTADIGLRLETGAATAEVRVFSSRYRDYLFLAPTGALHDELPVFAYRQQDARFHGLEARAELPLGTDTGFTLTLSGDAVRGRLRRDGDLPRMPPLRLGAGLSWQRGPLAARLAVRQYLKQDRTAALESPTGAFTLVDADATWRPARAAPHVLVFLRLANLLDAEARLHTSPLKDDLPLPGRSLAAGLRLAF